MIFFVYGNINDDILHGYGDDDIFPGNSYDGDDDYVYDYCDNSNNGCDDDNYNSRDLEVERNENDDIDNSYDYFGYNHGDCHYDNY